MPGNFIDTNILIYLASADTNKADLAEAAVAAGGAISVQVLNELTHVARRKMRMSWNETNALLATLRELLTVHPLTVEVHETGLRFAEHYRLSVYDAMIAASAFHAECDTLLSEDMQHGMMLGEGLRIVNPFAKQRQAVLFFKKELLALPAALWRPDGTRRSERW